MSDENKKFQIRVSQEVIDLMVKMDPVEIKKMLEKNKVENLDFFMEGLPSSATQDILIPEGDNLSDSQLNMLEQEYNRYVFWGFTFPEFLLQEINSNEEKLNPNLKDALLKITHGLSILLLSFNKIAYVNIKAILIDTLISRLICFQFMYISLDSEKCFKRILEQNFIYTHTWYCLQIYICGRYKINPDLLVVSYRIRNMVNEYIEKKKTNESETNNITK